MLYAVFHATPHYANLTDIMPQRATGHVKQQPAPSARLYATSLFAARRKMRAALST